MVGLKIRWLYPLVGLRPPNSGYFIRLYCIWYYHLQSFLLRCGKNYMQLQCLNKSTMKCLLIQYLMPIDQSAGAIEYNECISAEGLDSPNESSSRLGLWNTSTASLLKCKTSLPSGLVGWGYGIHRLYLCRG